MRTTRTTSEAAAPALARVLRPHAMQDVYMNEQSRKPGWVDALEESLLLAIGLFSLITWIVMLGLVGH